MKLYTYFRSSAAYRTRIALNLKGVQHDAVEVDLRAPASDQQKPDYRSINPQALVPALAVEGATIAQSLAIIEYLDEVYPDPALMPRSPVNRARGVNVAVIGWLRSFDEILGVDGGRGGVVATVGHVRRFTTAVDRTLPGEAAHCGGNDTSRR